MIQFPLKYEAKLEADAKITNKWSCKANSGETVDCAVPPEFNGPGHGFTPEDFFAMAVLSCITAALKVLCEKHKVSFNKIKGKAVLNMDTNKTDNTLYFTEIDINIEVSGASNVEAVKKLLEKAIATCPVCAAIKTSKTFHLNVS